MSDIVKQMLRRCCRTNYFFNILVAMFAGTDKLVEATVQRLKASDCFVRLHRNIKFIDFFFYYKITRF